MAVIFGRETFRFWTIEGQPKLWGVILSTIGATLMVVWKGPQIIGPLVNGQEIIGHLMVVIAILIGAGSSLLLEHAAITYHADLSLTALMGVCGIVSIAIVATLIERDVSAWKISWDELGTMIYGGVMIMGVASYVTIWCTRIKGPVFFSAFSPLLIVFSFLIETFILRKAAHLGSIVGAILVVIGLYFLLWAKANERRKDKKEDGSLESLLNDPHQPLIEQQD
ncbi:WAT1-related protein At5g64700-like [Macadamia integrifolia]|uniref:WAT1-related protein At5g64700-like n=1 Tax=Macadamia integrifolia TaxID=60698 RepID=UPI001C4E513F|nr:WAT1-related protein At5g64700-like [Macadamia integrifolia]